MQELKNCPCCGSDETIIQRTGIGTYRASCLSCRLSTAGNETEQEAADKWNTRKVDAQ